MITPHVWKGSSQRHSMLSSAQWKYICEHECVTRLCMCFSCYPYQNWIQPCSFAVLSYLSFRLLLFKWTFFHTSVCPPSVTPGRFVPLFWQTPCCWWLRGSRDLSTSNLSWSLSTLRFQRPSWICRITALRFPTGYVTALHPTPHITDRAFMAEVILLYVWC